MIDDLLKVPCIPSHRGFRKGLEDMNLDAKRSQSSPRRGTASQWFKLTAVSSQRLASAAQSSCGAPSAAAACARRRNCPEPISGSRWSSAGTWALGATEERCRRPMRRGARRRMAHGAQGAEAMELRK